MDLYSSDSLYVGAVIFNFVSYSHDMNLTPSSGDHTGHLLRLFYCFDDPGGAHGGNLQELEIGYCLQVLGLMRVCRENAQIKSVP